MKSQLIEYYNQATLWGQERNIDEVERIRILISLIPEGVKTILDAGCGDGAISNIILDRYSSVYSMDISQEALKHVKANKILGNLDCIPFGPCYVDLVISSEVIEHLPTGVYEKALLEMSRVAHKFILISVPNNESLDESLALCNTCGNRFNIWHHVRRFSQEDLRDIFVGFKMIRIEHCGPTHKVTNRFLANLVRRLGGGWAYSATAICTECGSRDIKKSTRNILTMGINFLNRCVSFKTRRRWIIALYERRG